MGFLPFKHRAIMRLLQVPFLGTTLLAMRERQIPGIMGNLLCWTWFIDDTFRDILANEVAQVAILGAGFAITNPAISMPEGEFYKRRGHFNEPQETRFFV